MRNTQKADHLSGRSAFLFALWDDPAGRIQNFPGAIDFFVGCVIMRKESDGAHKEIIHRRIGERRKRT